MRIAVAAMWAAGAALGLGGRPALPFNDMSFEPRFPTPVIYLHGINSRTRAFRQNAEYLRDRGYWVWGYDYGDQLAPGVRGIGDLDAIVGDVAENVDRVLTRTGAEQVDIVAHSQGGLMTKLYIAAGGAEKVRRVVAMGANFHGTDFHGRVSWMGPLLTDHPWLGRLFATRGASQQLAGSAWAAERAGIPDTDPRVVYTSLYSPADTVVTPNSASALRDEGADVANIDVAEWYDGYAPHHSLMPRDPLFAVLTEWGLSREPGDHTPPRVEWI
ncbi:alpha/beta fold hydrolase [Corynebacterium stercoris]|nr:alpha/beta fold hydrolase [Corynebacterium stercoris]